MTIGNLLGTTFLTRWYGLDYSSHSQLCPAFGGTCTWVVLTTQRHLRICHSGHNLSRENVVAIPEARDGDDNYYDGVATEFLRSGYFTKLTAVFRTSGHPNIVGSERR